MNTIEPMLAGMSPGPDMPLVRRAQVWIDDPDPIANIARGLGPDPLAVVLLFISPDADFAALVSQAQTDLEARHIVACTTAGEIGEAGYEDDMVVAVGLPLSDFLVKSYAIEHLDRIDEQHEIDRMIRTRVALGDISAEMDHKFAFLTVDGLSLSEDVLTGILAAGLGGMPMFGGSSGDGIRFRRTQLALDGHVMDNAAIVTLVAARGRVEVFSLNHLRPTETKMVVTEADPANRIVRQINAEPAAQEYARIVGKSPDALDQFTFAAHPVVVQLGGRHHVRAIQQVGPDGALHFFSAIDEGMVLTLAESDNMVDHLEQELNRLSARGAPDAILSCDCILRRLEAGQNQQMRAISSVLSDHKVVGFGTYGEQFGALHVNHTMTGVAFYPPEDHNR